MHTLSGERDKNLEESRINALCAQCPYITRVTFVFNSFLERNNLHQRFNNRSNSLVISPVLRVQIINLLNNTDTMSIMFYS